MTTRTSLFFSFLDRYASLVISVGSSMVIARLLTPSEVGVFSVTMVLLTLVSTVRDMGAGQYLIQEKELTSERIRAVWAVQLGLGVGLACLIVLASWPTAAFYNEPGMRNIMLVIALSYAVNPFGSLTYAWLMREMRFESVALMRFAAAFSGAVVSIFLAWHHFGPISLAFGSLASTVANALLAIYFRPAAFPWLPGVREIRRVFTFGSHLAGSTVINVLCNSAPELLVGKLQNLTAAGLYSRSSGLVQMFQRLFVDAVSVVCLPWFARQSRDEGSFAEPYLRATSYVTACGWSFCLAVVCLAHPIMRLLYGSQWDDAVDLTRLLAVAAVFSVPASLCGVALLSAGAVTTISRVAAINAVQSIALVAAGASQGLMGLGIAVIVSSGLTAFLWIRATARLARLRFSDLVRTLRQSAMVAACSCVVPSLVLATYGPRPVAVLEPLLIGGSGCLAGFVAGVMVLRHPLRSEIEGLWLKFTSR